MKIVIISFLILTFFSCQTKNNETQSENKYAYAPPAKNVGILYNLFLFTKQDIPLFQKKLPVCIERTGDEALDQSLLLETRIAYYKWLSAVEQLSEEKWNVFEFFLADACEAKSNEFISYIKIQNEFDVSQSDDETIFSRAKAVCKKKQLFRCQSDSSFVGYGSGAELTYYFFPNKPEIWTKISIKAPAKVILSPFVNWLPLHEAMDSIFQSVNSKGEAEKYNQDLTTFVQIYKHALNSNFLRFDDIKEFSRLLNKLELIYEEADPELAKITNDFQISGEKEFTGEFKLTIPLFSILLHEVGHQFGMSHAHQPRPDDITGQSDKAEFNAEKQQWICTESRMAYGKKYLYLTEDDLMGAESLFLASKEFVNSVTMQ
ncbi:MAG: hypothetical protein KBD78_10450 [Oligoflexales bacterium]|nr:hypothetical protein [Oligoflexales bacterium]